MKLCCSGQAVDRKKPGTGIALVTGTKRRHVAPEKVDMEAKVDAGSLGGGVLRECHHQRGGPTGGSSAVIRADGAAPWS